MNPSTTTETTAELLRLILPQMAQLGVPVTPQNYAVWFEHVAGTNPALSDQIEQCRTEGKRFDAATCEDLYRRYVAEDDLDLLEHVRDEMAAVLREMGQSVAAAGQNVGHYSGQLVAISQDVDSAADIRDLKDLLRTLVAETRAMQAVTREIKEHFDHKSAEIAVLQEELAHERHRAVTDALTGLLNRQALYDAIDNALHDKDVQGTPALLMVDIDHFKRINDAFGHLIGDRVIRFVAKVLTKHTKGKDTAARYGGEEFAVLLPETGLQGARAVAETLRRAVADAKLVRADTKDSLGKVTISLGIASYRRGEDTLAFVNRADQALYAAKRAGRNRTLTEAELPAAARA